MSAEHTNEVYLTALAGLLHDIGKFAQRAGWRQGRHAEVGAGWVEHNHDLFPREVWDDLVDAVAEHHGKLPHKRIAKVVQLADWMAAGERRTEQIPRSEPDSTPLIPVLSRLTLVRPRPEEAWGMNLTSLALDRSSLFPQPQLQTIEVGRYKDLWERFQEEVGRLRTGGVVITGERHFVSLLSLLRKYTCCMPSATPRETGEDRERTVPDVSLYDHLKVTAAIAACLERGLSDDEVDRLLRGEDAAWQQPVARLLRADLSGIQRFIYRITRPAGDAAFRGAAKRLRGRSFYLILLGDVVGDWLLRRLGLTVANLLFCGGGLFDLLVPKDVNTRQDLDRCLQELEAWLLETFYGELGIQFAEAEVTPADFSDMGRLYGELGHKLVQAKSKKWETRIGQAGFYVATKDEYHACPICHLSSMPEPRICPACEQHHAIGGKLPDTTHLALVHGKPHSPDGAVSVSFDAFGITALLMGQKEVRSFLEQAQQEPPRGVLYRLNDTDFVPSNMPPVVDMGFRFLANSVPVALERLQLPDHEPTEPGDILDFEEIARLSTGAARLGVLKADVDHLGLLFSDGLEPATISRQAALSQAIDIFFCGWLNRLCEEVSADWWRAVGQKRLPRGQVSNLFYVLYSGGDDLFVIGPWDQTLELARRLQVNLSEYACHNPNVTISAGVVQVKPHYPIQRFAELVDNRLKTAKDDGRNCISTFAQTLSWQDDVSGLPGLGSVLNFARQLVAAVGEDTLPRSLVHYLGRLYRQHFEDGNGKPDLLFLPKLQYAIRRRVKKEVDESLQLMDRLWWQKMMWYAPVLVSYISLSTREE